MCCAIEMKVLSWQIHVDEIGLCINQYARPNS